MFFLAAMFVVGLSCIAISYKVLVGYSTFPWWVKTLTLLLLIVAWFSPVLLRIVRNYQILSPSSYAFVAKAAYFMMGFAFILVMLLIVRDLLWYLIYYIDRRPEISPDNVSLINRNNLITLFLTLAISVYGVYEAHKIPAIKELNIADSRIKQNVRVVVASDFHIDQATPMGQIKQFVETINSLKPDYVLLAGDVIDDVPDALEKEMEELKKIEAQKVYVTLGNHEYYNEPVKWMIKFTQMGFDVLHNTGEAVADTGIYIGGVPDAQSARVRFDKAGYGATDEQYKILVSHSPTTAPDLEKGQFDLQVSGHTHGGQIFPFNFLAEEVNGFLAGMYEVNGNKLYVTRGAGYWGPPMRILAPSDMTVINLTAGDDK